METVFDFSHALSFALGADPDEEQPLTWYELAGACVLALRDEIYLEVRPTGGEDAC